MAGAATRSVDSEMGAALPRLAHLVQSVAPQHSHTPLLPLAPHPVANHGDGSPVQPVSRIPIPWHVFVHSVATYWRRHHRPRLPALRHV